MKTKAILFASVLLVGCQSGPDWSTTAGQRAQNSSSTSLKTGKIATDNTNQLAAYWGEGDSGAQHELWGYIRDELKMKIPDNYRVREQRNYYLKNKSYLHDVTLRAEPYMYWIVRQIKQRDMPMELVLVPIVESAFNPHATSHAKAAGLWQIIPDTGRNYGLTQDKWYDARRDVAASTTAALNLLQRLNKMFNGDWLLAIAAYNSGEGRVMRAIKENQIKGKPTDFWSLSLPRETALYVPKVLALSDVIRNSDKYGITLPKSNNQRALAQIDVGQQITLSQAAELAGMSLTSIKAYNPGYKRGVTSPNGPHYIMLPKAKVNQFKNSLANKTVLSNIRQEVAKNNHRLSKQSQYKVRSGDTLSAIAKRFNISTRELQRLNNLKTARLLKIGQLLRVNNDNAIIYRVRQGDSIASIAKRHGINIKDLMNWNDGIKTTDIKPGIELTLYINEYYDEA
ncbi:murein transglycosylase D [Photorhabdus laumondii subsp. laumondii]|uniref:peptidoglycan lytic exotransglycosylase n=2 Tax=Photorhabdus laumondii subsp. laumondii TaxID=141679 RepID=Q7N810_PHOLL|nr:MULTISPECIES: murein transglycosylase D [Photorhabdus]AWK40865.1 lytic transglycosylase [Photorhabdus laumondii subsp. laumondii]AXG41672.1 murein transglycosylase D [Photorhabdus laumondii subsp. laumondii]AXG46201.1 murein transglycosylase D [Photorhabdus laumondii subsp. laumondii]KTL60393.1 lytic transglycosylase [Photorhabdus laumondii subsp. laumondii]MCC8386287.1 murein transglycosylase D [Photorhabdus laumondii]